mmetsp:Transcript_47607/g.119178  ORF Transcript_47607/g.119178 Transcript_47607/m.119178 type:complete len:287 (+) Transcript_47607:267-1127(+)
MIALLRASLEAGHERRQQVLLILAATPVTGAIANERDIHGALLWRQRRNDARPEEGLEFGLELFPLLLAHARALKLQHQRVRAVGHLLSQPHQRGRLPAGKPLRAAELEHAAERLVQVLLVTVAEARGVLAHLLLDVRHLGVAQLKRRLAGLARHRLQFGVLERQADQRDGEPVHEQHRAQVRSGQQVDVGPKAVHHQRDADGRRDAAKGHLGDIEPLVGQIFVTIRASAAGQLLRPASDPHRGGGCWRQRRPAARGGNAHRRRGEGDAACAEGGGPPRWAAGSRN